MYTEAMRESVGTKLAPSVLTAATFCLVTRLNEKQIVTAETNQNRLTDHATLMRVYKVVQNK